MTISPAARRQLGVGLEKKTLGKEVADILDGLTTNKVVDEVLTLTNAVSRAMSATIPVGAVITSIAVNLQTAVASDGSGDNLFTRIGVGIAGNVAKYGATGALTKNQKLTRMPAHAVLSAAEQLTLFTVQANGTTASTAKFVAGAKVRVRITYETAQPLPDA